MSEMPVSESALDIMEVMRILPHRYPFLLIDRVLSVEPGKNIRAIKNVTVNEPFFPGHFPNRPVMPGVLIIEAMAQAAGVLVFRSQQTVPSAEDRLYLVGIDAARFRRPVEPGDQLVLTATATRQLKGIWKFEAQAEVGGRVAASAEIMVAPQAKPGR